MCNQKCWCLTEVFGFVSPRGLGKPTTRLLQQQDADATFLQCVRFDEKNRMQNTITSCILADWPRPSVDCYNNTNSRKQVGSRWCGHDFAMCSVRQNTMEKNTIILGATGNMVGTFTRSSLENCTNIANSTLQSVSNDLDREKTSRNAQTGFR